MTHALPATVFLLASAIPLLFLSGLPPYADNFFDLQQEIVKCDRALRGYLSLFRHSLKKALAQSLLDLTELARHAIVDWWRKLALLRINSQAATSNNI